MAYSTGAANARQAVGALHNSRLSPEVWAHVGVPGLHRKVDGTRREVQAAVVALREADATTAMNQTNERQQAVIDELIGLGIDRTDIATTEANLQPQFGPEDNTITAYRATNSINVKIRNLDQASDAIGLIVETGGNATRINSISYSIEDDSQLVRDARARAFEDAEDRAEQYAELAGMSLGKVISISEAAGTTPPIPMPVPRGAMEAAVPLEPGQQTVGFSVTVIWELS